MSKDIHLEVNPQKIRESLQGISSKFLQYAAFIATVIILLAYSFIVMKIGTYTRSEPTDAQVGEQLKTVKRPKIDEDSIKKIEQLEDQNIAVQSLFEEARQNPFQD